jgi:hypothetical protein
MEGLLKKLNIKEQASIAILNAPAALLPQLQQAFDPQIKVTTHARSFESVVLLFCTRLKEVETLATATAPLLEPDALFWIAYPKGSSQKYKCDFNRDNGWATLAKLGYEPVRQIAIDEDWSALRFRNPDFIKTMTRGFAATEKGIAKVKAQKKTKE